MVGPGTSTSKSRDILSNLQYAFLVFWLPVIAIVVGGISGVSSKWRTIVWTITLSTMGAACVANALRCGRVHCYLTGPFFLVMALVAALYGLGMLPLGTNGWNVIGLTILIGAIGLCCLPEMFLGKYRKGHSGDDKHC